MLRRLFLVSTYVSVVAIATGAGESSPQLVDFENQVAPIFREHCLHCHRPGNAKGDLSLSTIGDLKENDYVIDGDSENSYLMELITSVDGNPPEMPQDGQPLSDEQVDLVRRWIDQGCEWPEGLHIKHKPKGGPDWWSFQPLKTSHPLSPRIEGAGQHSETVDFYIDRKLSDAGLVRNPPADRPTLIRRATYDLIGLPPTPEEVDAFVNDDSPEAYEKLIDRLLDSPHYGERWARHWLDVVRFGESVGFERNGIIDSLWPFRDYVIQSLNEDKPFDQLIHEHLAGDVLAPEDPETVIGSAFLVAGPFDNVNNQDAVQQAQIRANTIDEMIRATSEAFLGLTIGCARCHDHKFDPVAQEDYYSLYASLAGVVHGDATLASPADKAERAKNIQPLNAVKAELEKQNAELRGVVLERAQKNIEEYTGSWIRPPVDRTGTIESFEDVTAKFVRLVCEAQDIKPASSSGFRIDEFEVWSAGSSPRNVALASNGGVASGRARQIEDFPDAYGPQLAIDGKTGARFLAIGNDLTIELARPTTINRVVFSSAIGEPHPEHQKFVFVADYRLEVSEDGKAWREVASGRNRQPAQTAASPDGRVHREHRLMNLAMTDDEKARQRALTKQLAAAKRKIASVPRLPTAWIGKRDHGLAKGPFHVFLGGSPQKKGDQVLPHSLSVFESWGDDEVGGQRSFLYALSGDAPESERRLTLARWMTHASNPLTPRVLANRLWHYHFGTGIVSTPSDFGYMGGKPSHPQLLDFLALQLRKSGWRIKPIHRMLMLTKTYQQGSEFRETASDLDGDARLLWRFPPRRLSAEEVRDTILQVSGGWSRESILHESGKLPGPAGLVPDGGPGFRLYHYMQDNVSTYRPLDLHGPETFRRAIYHQNARASVVDLMTDFDQPDCAFSTPRRARTTTPLQALTMLNHRFTLDMAETFARRLTSYSQDTRPRIRQAYALCYARTTMDEELDLCESFIAEHGLPAFCRALLNTSELIYVK